MSEVTNIEKIDIIEDEVINVEENLDEKTEENKTEESVEEKFYTVLGVMFDITKKRYYLKW